MRKMNPLQKRNHELLGMPSIQSQFPINFENGNGWDEFNVHCDSCGNVLASDLVTGIVSKPMPKVAVIEAVGCCDKCKAVFNIDYRMYDNLSVTCMIQGVWYILIAKKSAWKRIVSVFNKLLAQKENK
jgi:hypothetical protein